MEAGTDAPTVDARGHAPRGIDRRTLIRRAAGVGVVAWTAPVVLDSVMSPAGAGTITCPANCAAPPTYVQMAGANCRDVPTTTAPLFSPICEPADWAAAQPTLQGCVTADSCSNAPSITFQITCPNYTFRGATAELQGNDPTQCAVLASCGLTSVTFTKTTSEGWKAFRFTLCPGPAPLSSQLSTEQSTAPDPAAQLDAQPAPGPLDGQPFGGTPDTSGTPDATATP